MIQGRGVVCSVSGYGHYRFFFLEQLYQALLVRRTGTGHDFQVHNSVECFLVAEFGKCNAGDSVLFGICFRIPKTYLACYFGRCPRSVSGYDFYINACRLAFGYGSRYVRANRVGYGQRLLRSSNRFLLPVPYSRRGHLFQRF